MEIEQLHEVFRKHPEVTTDSRKCPKDSMFFALKGESFDGNRFAAAALEAGCRVAVVDDANVIPKGDRRYILVDDALKALQDMAAFHRKRYNKHVVQITGTNGKTTTKELIAAILSRRYEVLYTEGNMNNHIGVPLTLLRMTEYHDFAVIETGANHPGEIALLTSIVDPDFGLVTNVGHAHIEGFGSFEGVKKTKGELYDYLAKKESGRIFVNESNYDLQDMLVERNIDIDSRKCICYAREQALTQTWAVEGDMISCDPFLKIWWREYMNYVEKVQTKLIGAYNLDNVLAAICVASTLGMNYAEIKSALAEYQPGLGRSEFRQTKKNRLIIDAYNANPTSMHAALDNFRKIIADRKMVILGDMRELGADSEEEHLRIVAEVIGSDIQVAWFVGEMFADALSKFKVPKGLAVSVFANVEAVKAAIAAEPPVNAYILIKGSNSMKLHLLPPLL
ncbi:MAG: UDP-N-acetylmuramoyl-tripeptide--D-alanyl-D-alanine ligase [Bacteroidaceae bacterium]|nr:UDP-N-acetylmuramoyl-tripeptide--D-alanyl-D-alanine ligase [Bacteroidaceae bacterium]